MTAPLPAPLAPVDPAEAGSGGAGSNAGIVLLGVDPDAVVRAASACPSVAAVAHDGSAATYLPGRRVHGVTVNDHLVTVHVVARWNVPVATVADEVIAAITPHAAGRPVAVRIVDVVAPALP